MSDMNKKDKKRKKRNKKYFKLTIAIIPIILSIVAICFTICENNREKIILEPRFSLEKIVNEDGYFTWKISNSGGAINNATIYPTLYVTMYFYDEELTEIAEVTLETNNYYTDEDYYYSSSDGAFYVKEKKQAELNDFIEKYRFSFCSDGIGSMTYSITSYFTLNYNDCMGQHYNKIYTTTDNIVDDNPERIILSDTMRQLKEIDEISRPDISAPFSFNSSCVISVNYKNATTIQILTAEQEYNNYLYSVIWDLIDSKDKPIEEMYGSAILSNGILWVGDMESGELIWLDDNVKDFGYTVGGDLMWITYDGDCMIFGEN